MEAALQSWLDERRPGARLVRAWPLTGGVASLMTAFEARMPDGEAHRFILRAPGAAEGPGSERMARKELAVLTWLGARGQPVPRVHDLDPTGERFGHPALIVEMIDGDIDLDPKHPAAFAAEVAGRLASLHALGSPAGDLPILRHRNDGIGALLRERPPGGRDQPYADALAFWPPPQVNADVLVHGDFWPGNMIWRDGRIAGIIDWEDCAVGDPLGDLAVTRLDTLWVLDWEAMVEVTERYFAASGADPTALPYWDLAAALRPGDNLALWAAPWPRKGRPDVTAEAMAAKLQRFGDEALQALAGPRSG